MSARTSGSFMRSARKAFSRTLPCTIACATVYWMLNFAWYSPSGVALSMMSSPALYDARRIFFTSLCVRPCLALSSSTPSIAGNVWPQQPWFLNVMWTM